MMMSIEGGGEEEVVEGVEEEGESNLRVGEPGTPGVYLPLGGALPAKEGEEGGGQGGGRSVE